MPIALQVHLGLPQAEETRLIQAACDAVRHHRFALDRPPLLVATLLDFGDHGFLALLVSHLIVDAWALGIIHGELAEIWRALGRGEEPALPPLALQPSDYAAAAEETLGEILARGPAAFVPWPPTGYRLPLDAPLPAQPQIQGAVHVVSIEPELWSRARTAAAALDLPAAATVLVAFQVALHRHGQRPDVAFSVGHGNRNEPALRTLVACLVYTETFEGTLGADDTWADLLARTRPVLVEQRLERMAYDLLVKPPSTRILYNFHNFEAAAGSATAPFAYAIEAVRYPYIWSMHDLVLQAFPVAGGLRIAALVPRRGAARRDDRNNRGLAEARAGRPRRRSVRASGLSPYRRVGSLGGAKK